ncbi:hypothetical protein [Legionella micdadei]|uniref:Uncharacterized protein n=1 Tax=Legionella micdadei TaxID=451 RepID=A0A098GHF2_LEGMI|nr:hypothetical protein [Legionella micdadei]ARG97531.1 hypothetical protein B6N58_07540 [Legionella micdadei]ARH00159.1 hypothetical protein B6V88_06880 [Legionella micdadei]KTD27604.1 hypothetical protein Lmic_1924 [Legionella micdadei]NSL17586.1 hypothetical protein [Legionella micdadei]CEG60911.1 conserved protein of unknown function [Legionella micdadei]
MKHEKLIRHLVSEFKHKLNGLSSEQLANFNLQIKLIPTVGEEAGGAMNARRVKTEPSTRLDPLIPGNRSLSDLKKAR